ncbi:MAG: hypothetical protein AABW91_02525 [Nanoarchaeota archaeon]
MAYLTLNDQKEKNGNNGYSSRDVGELYEFINSDELDENGFLEVISAGVDLGHPGVIFHACARSKSKISKGAAYNALNNALGLRRWDIANPNVAVGELYQALYERDFEEACSQIVIFDEAGNPVMEGDKQKVKVVPYAYFHPVEKRMVQFVSLEQKNFDIRDRLKNYKQTLRSKGRNLSLQDMFFIHSVDLFFHRFPVSDGESEH